MELSNDQDQRAMSSYSDSLTKCSYFTDLSKEQLEKVAALANKQTHQRNGVVLKEADLGDAIFLIIKGRVDVTVSLVGSSKRETIATLGEGEIIGEMILLGKNRRTADVTAKDDLETLALPVAQLTKLFDSDPKIGYIVMRNIAKQMAERLIATNQVLRNALTVATSPIF
jgi:CRP-like cAMP-binding protein